MPKNITPTQNQADWTFLNHYILFPHDAQNKKSRKKNLYKSILIGIPTFGLLHAGCALIYALKKLNGRVNKTPPPNVSQKPYSVAETKIIPDLKNSPPAPINLKLLTQDQIKKMAPDEQGYLIDHYAVRKANGPSDLTLTQLQGMIGFTAPSSIAIVNAQEAGLGHCGRYAINNALQREALSQTEFLALTGQIFSEKLGMSLEDVRNLIQNQNDFGVDTAIIAEILKQKLGLSVKQDKISDLPNCAVSKQQAMENYIGKANWVIVANIGEAIYDMPSPTNAIYSLTRGHFAALRRDAHNQWWFLDSRANKAVNIALAIIPRTCTMITTLDAST